MFLGSNPTSGVYGCGETSHTSRGFWIPSLKCLDTNSHSTGNKEELEMWMCSGGAASTLQ